MQSSEPDNIVTKQPTLFRAAEYVRMSTEHQQYSTENQADKIREYATRRGIEIVRTYADEGKSGLNIGGRPALQNLINDVESGNADFQIILVYDISRWGRFQDADESAYYEYRCRRAGIHVAYCAEQFENDGSPVSTIVKSIKRAMAGEYSRELSGKVFAGQCRLIELGYRQGGPAGYGLRRILVDQHGVIKTELMHGEQKNLQTDRVILKPGPEEEVRIIGLIYRWFIDEGLFESEIANRLNEMSIRADLDRDWTRRMVRQVLTNAKYIGDNVFNRNSYKLKKMRVANTPDMWIIKEGAFEPIVPLDVFYRAQDIFRARVHQCTDEELIQKLRTLYQKRGFLNAHMIDETEGMASAGLYARRFGSLIRAYEMAGFYADCDYSYWETHRFLRRFHTEIITKTENMLSSMGGVVRRDPDTDLFTINEEFNVSLVVARCQTLRSGSKRWKIRFDASLVPDITIAIRLDQDNRNPLDYYLLPRMDFEQPHIFLADRNSAEFESYRFDNLDYFFGMVRRATVRRAA
jgi:DNA invertase Pin-like site-specific DNA recombinase